MQEKYIFHAETETLPANHKSNCQKSHSCWCLYYSRLDRHHLWYNWKAGTRGATVFPSSSSRFFRYVIFKDRSSNSGQQHLGLLIIPAGYGKPGTGKKVKNTSVFPKLCTQNATAFDLLPSFVRRWLRVISSSFLLAGSRNYQIIGLPFCLTD